MGGKERPLFVPVDGRIVHLVDEDDEVFDAGRFGQHGVLSRLPAFLEARLKLAFPSRDDLIVSLECFKTNTVSSGQSQFLCYQDGQVGL